MTFVGHTVQSGQFFLVYYSKFTGTCGTKQVIFLGVVLADMSTDHEHRLFQ